MLLIADSGGTKTTWAFVETSDEVDYSETDGMHPYFQTTYQLSQTVQHLPQEWVAETKELYFYGAGLGAKEQASKIEYVLKDYFSDSTQIEVQTDMVGTARALCQHEAGMTAILGTGSNTCLYDGQQIVQNSRGFGFILGDEGSGAVMGKCLITDYLYNRIPKGFRYKLEDRYDLTTDDILKRVYQEDAPNRYLASFSHFIYEYREETYFQTLLQAHFSDFFEKCIVVFDDYENLPLHLTGSIAFYFLADIQRVAAKFGVSIGKVLRDPLEGLVAYHSGR